MKCSIIDIQVNPPNIYSSIDGDLLPGWQIIEVQTDDSLPASAPVPQEPVSTGRGGMGHAACLWAGPGEGLGFYSPYSSAVNTTLLQFWIYTDTATMFDALVTVGNHADPNITCPYLDLSRVDAITQYQGWISYYLFPPILQSYEAGDKPSQIFQGCAGHAADEIDTFYILNSRPESQWLCLDDILFR